MLDENIIVHSIGDSMAVPAMFSPKKNIEKIDLRNIMIITQENG